MSSEIEQGTLVFSSPLGSDGGGGTQDAEVLLLFRAADREAASAVTGIQRPARLFVAGEYPDKGVTITEAHLDQIVARFTAGGSSVPIKVEHIDSPLDPLGSVIGLYRRGGDLYGMLVFSAGVNQHLRERSVENLSVALVREPDEKGGGFSLKETSLVLKPRVVGAGFLSVTERVSAFRQAGKLTPAMEPHLAALLCAAPLLTFSDGSGGSSPINVAEIVDKLLAAMPVVQPRGAAVASEFGGMRRGSLAASGEEGGIIGAMARAFGVEAKKVAANVAMMTTIRERKESNDYGGADRQL